MSELYISNMTLRESRPRSKRLLGLGFSRPAAIESQSTTNLAFDELFEKVTIGQDGDGNPIYAIHAKYTLYSDYDIVAGGAPGSAGQQSSGALYLLADVAKAADGEHVGQTSGGIAATAGQVLGFDGTHWHAVDMQGGGGASVSWGTESGNKIPLTVGSVSKTLLMDGALSDYLLKTQVTWGTASGNTVPLTIQGVTKTLLLDGALSGYLPKSGGQMSGNLHMYGNKITLCTYTSAEDCVLYADSSENVFLKSYKNIYLTSSQGTIYANGARLVTSADVPTRLSELIDDLGSSPTHTHGQYAQKNGSTSEAFSAKSLTIPSTGITGFIRIGNAYLWYDAVKKALMVSAATGSTDKIAIIATGDISAGGTITTT